jgi:hypothetical protein
MEYEVEALRPIGRGLWSASMLMKLPTPLPGAPGAGAACSLRVRFSALEGQTATALLQLAHQEARRCLAALGDELSRRSAQDLQEAFYARGEALKRLTGEIPSTWEPPNEAELDGPGVILPD